MTELLLVGLIWMFCLGYVVGRVRSVSHSSSTRVVEVPEEDPRKAVHDGPIFDGQHVSKGRWRNH